MNKVLFSKELEHLLGMFEMLKDAKDGSIELRKRETDLLLDFITSLEQENEKYKKKCYLAHKMIYDNYGILDKYEIDMLDDILQGE